MLPTLAHADQLPPSDAFPERGGAGSLKASVLVCPSTDRLSASTRDQLDQGEYKGEGDLTVTPAPCCWIVATGVAEPDRRGSAFLPADLDLVPRVAWANEATWMLLEEGPSAHSSRRPR